MLAKPTIQFAWDNSIINTTNVRYHQRLCLEAWHMNPTRSLEPWWRNLFMRRSNRNFNPPSPSGKARAFELLKVESFKLPTPRAKMVFKCPTLASDLSEKRPLLKSNLRRVTWSFSGLCTFAARRDINSRWEAILDASYAVVFISQVLLFKGS